MLQLFILLVSPFLSAQGLAQDSMRPNLDLDVDGDGRRTPGDRMILDIWKEQGGDPDLLANRLRRSSGGTTARPDPESSSGSHPARAGSMGCDPFIRGDANVDANVDNADVITILNYITGQGSLPSTPDAADVNDDGSIDISDPITLLNYLFSGGAPPAMPFPDAGYDPTPDALGADCDSILSLNSNLLTDYVAPFTSIQNVRPLAEQRGVGLDGFLRAAPHMEMTLAGNPYARPILWTETIQEATGTAAFEEIDIELPARGFKWIIGRTHNARQKNSGNGYHVSSGYQGNNWFQSSQPELVLTTLPGSTQSVLYLVYGADRFVEFVHVVSSGGSDTFRATNGANALVVSTAATAKSPEIYRMFDSDGMVFDFFGFDASAGAAAGQLWRITDPAANVAFVGHSTDPFAAIQAGFDEGRIRVAYDTEDRRYTYTYAPVDGVERLISVLAEERSGRDWDNPGTVTTLSEVAYDYCDAASPFGLSGDLRSVAVTEYQSDGTQRTRRSYYRYYEFSGPDGHPGAIQIVLGPEGARRFDWEADGTPGLFDQGFLGADLGDLRPFADGYYLYDVERRVRSAWFTGDCDCGASPNGGYTYEYQELGSPDFGYEANEFRFRTVVARPDGNFVTRYFDEVAQPLAHALTEGDPASPQHLWATLVIRNDGGIAVREHTPANVTGYDPTNDIFTVSAAQGLVHSFDLEESGICRGFVQSRRFGTGSGGTAYLEESFAHTTLEQQIGGATLSRPLLVTNSTFPAQQTSGSTGALTTTYEYQAHAGTLVPEIITTRRPVVAVSQNGSGAEAVELELYGLDEELVLEVSAAGIVSYYEYAQGLPTRAIADAQTGSLPITVPPGFQSTGTPQHETTDLQYDGHGRLIEVLSPAGERSVIHWTALADGREVSIEYARVLGNTYYSPAQYTVENHRGLTSVEGILTFPGNATTLGVELHVDESSSDPLAALPVAWNFENYMVFVREEAGLAIQEWRKYFDVPASGMGAAGSNYDAELRGYDELGQLVRRRAADGTIQRYVRAPDGAILAHYVGTNDSSFPGGSTGGADNTELVASYQYDGGAFNGNGFLTSETSYSGAGARSTSYANDTRGRPTLIQQPLPPHQLVAYDNLGRIEAIGSYQSTGGITATDDPRVVATGRVALRTLAHDALSQQYRERRYAIDVDSGANTDFLDSESWYDAGGRIRKVKGTTFEKYAYDRLDRLLGTFVLADDDDTGYADALNVNGDTVLSEQHVGYAFGSSRVQVEYEIARFHDDPNTTGSLDDSDGSTLVVTPAGMSGRPQITAFWHDEVGRTIDEVALGTYGNAQFNRSAFAAAPVPSDEALRTSHTYDGGSAPRSSTDPTGVVTWFDYDAMGREVTRIENYIPPGNPQDPDLNRTTRKTYTNGHLVVETMDLAGAALDQVWTYSYGTSGGGLTPLATGHLLNRVTLPDGGALRYEYNAQEEVIRQTDPAGTVVDLVVDARGRWTQVRATSLGGGVDGRVRSIQSVYDGAGRMTAVRQFDGPNPSTSNLVDEVGFELNDWLLLERLDQDVDATGTGFSVAFAYQKVTAGRPTVRRSYMDYPSGRRLRSDYAQGVANLASSVSALTFDGDRIVDYEVLGDGRRVGISYPEPRISSRRSGPTQGSYPSWDRFDRLARCTWARDLATPVTFYSAAYEYDRNSNRTLRVDEVHTGWDRQRILDSLRRLQRSTDGSWDGTQVVSVSRSNVFGLDLPSNWAFHARDRDGDGSYAGPDDLNETRTHGLVNEIQTRDTDSMGPIEYSLRHDGFENTTDDGRRFTYTFDAFYRLVEVRQRATGALYAENRYNGLGWRTQTHRDMDGDGILENNPNDPWFTNVFDRDGRRIALYRASDALPKAEYVYNVHTEEDGDTDPKSPILRDLDTSRPLTRVSDGTFEQRHYYCINPPSVVAIVDSSGGMVGWTNYSPAGAPFGLPPGDMDSDGDHDEGDSTLIARLKGYDVRADVNLDGVVNALDLDDLFGRTWGWEDPFPDDHDYGSESRLWDDLTELYGTSLGDYSPELGRTLQGLAPLGIYATFTTSLNQEAASSKELTEEELDALIKALQRLIGKPTAIERQRCIWDCLELAPLAGAGSGRFALDCMDCCEKACTRIELILCPLLTFDPTGIFPKPSIGKIVNGLVDDLTDALEGKIKELLKKKLKEKLKKLVEDRIKDGTKKALKKGIKELEKEIEKEIERIEGGEKPSGGAGGPVLLLVALVSLAVLRAGPKRAA